MAYRLFDHTADIGIEASGETFADALADAARGLGEVVTGRQISYDAAEPLQFQIEAPDEESLIVAFLSELLWLLESTGILWCSGGVTVVAGGPGWILDADANGVAYDPIRHGVGTEIKAITYHDLSVVRKKQVTLRVILDI